MSNYNNCIQFEMKFNYQNKLKKEEVSKKRVIITSKHITLLRLLLIKNNLIIAVIWLSQNFFQGMMIENVFQPNQILW